MLIIATEEDCRRVVEMFGINLFCLERLVLIQKRTKYDLIISHVTTKLGVAIKVNEIYFLSKFG